MTVFTLLLMVLVYAVPVVSLAGLIINIVRLRRQDNDEKKRKTAKRKIIVYAVFLAAFSCVTVSLLITGARAFSNYTEKRDAAMAERATAAVQSESTAE